MIVPGEKPAPAATGNRPNEIDSTREIPKVPVARKVFELAAVNRFALQRRNELCRLAKYLRANGLAEPPDLAWATVAADLAPFGFQAVGETTSDTLAVRIAHRVRAFAVSAGLTLDGDSIAVAANLAAESSKRWPMSARRAGSLLGLTSADREEIGARTMDAVDENAADRKSRLKREKHRRYRTRRGARPRDRSLSKTQPWKTEGVSRRTWERRRKEIEMSESATRDANTRPNLIFREEGGVANLRQLDDYIANERAKYERTEAFIAAVTAQQIAYVENCMKTVRRLPPEFWSRHALPEAIAAGLVTV